VTPVEERSQLLGRLARAVAARAVDEGPLTLRMCRACVSVLGVDGGCLTFGWERTGRVSLGATDEFARRLVDVQEVTGEGPMSRCYERAEIVRGVIDGTPDRRWPHFSEAAHRALGPCTVWALPIRPATEIVGVGTFYATDRGPDVQLGIDDGSAQLLVNAVGVALIDEFNRAGDDVLGPRLSRETPSQEAVQWRDESRIHQATGMVMAQLRLGPTDAMALLRAHAFAHDLTMLDLSERLLRRDLDFRTSDPDPREPR
jgi:hypothetical protein